MGNLDTSQFTTPAALAHSGFGRRFDFLQKLHDKNVATSNGCGFAGMNPNKTCKLQSAAIKFCYDLMDVREEVSILEVGCGTGDLASKFARAGAHVTVVDPVDTLSDEARRFCQTGAMDAIIRPAQDVPIEQLPKRVDEFVLDKVVHWMSYEAAKSLLERVSPLMSKNARAFISVAGFSSPLAKNAASSQVPIEKRHEEARGLGRFRSAVTLYTKDELHRLLGLTGLKPVEIFESNWGLWKVVAVRAEHRAERPRAALNH